VVWLPDGETIVKIRFDTIHERDGHTDRHTDNNRVAAKAALA